MQCRRRPEGTARWPLCADIDGTEQHAAVRVEAHDRKRLEQLCRYITRPALSDERVQLNAAGQVALKLAWLSVGGAQLRARKLSNASLKTARFWDDEPCRAFATMINCEPGMHRCAASESTLKNGRVNSPRVIVTGTLR